MPLGIQPIHLIFVALIALLIFGPRRLPEIGRGIGRAMIEFRKGTQEMTDNFRAEISQADHPAPTDTAASATKSQTPSAPAGGNFCTNCGTPNAAEARYCNQCGQQILR
jgi:sec-independent protein translocase protein TatA